MHPVVSLPITFVAGSTDHLYSVALGCLPIGTVALAESRQGWDVSFSYPTATRGPGSFGLRNMARFSVTRPTQKEALAAVIEEIGRAMYGTPTHTSIESTNDASDLIWQAEFRYE